MREPRANRGMEKVSWLSSVAFRMGQTNEMNHPDEMSCQSDDTKKRQVAFPLRPIVYARRA